MSLDCSDSSSASIECDLDVSIAESDTSSYASSDDNDWDGTRGIDNGSHTSRFTLVPNSLPSTVIR